MICRPLNRRSVLRGIGGVCLSLPVLEAMMNRSGTALAAGTTLPLRYLIGFGGYSLRSDGDTAPNPFAPDTFGPNYDLKKGTAPFANFGNVKDNISIIS